MFCLSRAPLTPWAGMCSGTTETKNSCTQPHAARSTTQHNNSSSKQPGTDCCSTACLLICLQPACLHSACLQPACNLPAGNLPACHSARLHSACILPACILPHCCSFESAGHRMGSCSCVTAGKEQPACSRPIRLRHCEPTKGRAHPAAPPKMLP